MKRESRRTFKELAYFSSLGISVALAVFIGLGIGVVLDRKLDTSPCLHLFFWDSVSPPVLETSGVS